MISPLIIDISPNLIKDLRQFGESIEYYYLMSEVIVFKPMENPKGLKRSWEKHWNVIR